MNSHKYSLNENSEKIKMLSEINRRESLLINTVSELLQELLIVFFCNLEKSVDEVLSIIDVEFSHVDFLVHHSVALVVVIVILERFYYTCS